MNIAITKQPTFEELQTKLSQQFPEYKLKMQGKKFLVVKKNSTCGVNIVIRKNKLMINGNFPTLGGRLIFTLLLLLLGIIIPMIIYFATFHKKFKIMEKEVSDYLQEQYRVL